MKKILQKIKPGQMILLFCDYDGTLVPIRKAPQDAVLTYKRRKVLRNISKKNLYWHCFRSRPSRYHENCRY